MSLDSVQRQLAANMRNPAKVEGPANIEQRRLKIYQGLIYRNIESFIGFGFPILKKLFAEERWHQMVRDFVIRHQCQTPYFFEISQEFLHYLQQEREPQADDPPFMLELAHYEWVELALDIADEDLADIAVNREGDLLEGSPVVSPLAWSLAYQFPVHLIGPDCQPEQPGEQPTYIVVYRNRDDKVEFLEANAVTARMLELLGEEQALTGLQVLERIAQELQHPNPPLVIEGGLATMQQLRDLDIILGTV